MAAFIQENAIYFGDGALVGAAIAFVIWLFSHRQLETGPISEGHSDQRGDNRGQDD